jgi:hypothetical protein
MIKLFQRIRIVLPCSLMFYYKRHHKLCHKPTQEKAELKEFANQK